MQNTQKITKAMELVAAAKMRKAEERVIAARPYAVALRSVIDELYARPLEYRHSWLLPEDVNRRILILVTTDRGLVGSLNASAWRTALRTVDADKIETAFVTIGRKGRDIVRRSGLEHMAEISGIGDSPSFDVILPAVDAAIQELKTGKAQRLDVVYSRFVSVARQQTVSIPLMPYEQTTLERRPADFSYEPDPRSVLEALLPRYLEAQVYRAVLENLASAQAAQMLAMRNASDNAGDLIEEFTLTANTLRQQTITSELMDIVGGAEALQTS